MLRVSFEVTWKWFSFPFNIIQRLLTNPWLFPSQTVKTCRSVYLMTQVPFRYIRLSREVELRLVFMQFKSIPHLINIVLNVTIAIGQSVKRSKSTALDGEQNDQAESMTSERAALLSNLPLLGDAETFSQVLKVLSTAVAYRDPYVHVAVKQLSLM